MSAIPRSSFKGKESPFRFERMLESEALRLGPLGKGGGNGLDLAAAAKDLIALQRGLTGDRKIIGGPYMDERARLASYLLFYWPISYAQTRALLSMAGAERRSGAIDILDLGSGPGPCALAAADQLSGIAPDERLLPAPRQVSIIARDRSLLALECGRRIAEAAGCAFAGDTRWDAESDADLPPGPFDAIVFGHVVNELWNGAADRLERRAELLERAFSRLKKGGVLIVLEPATLYSGRDALALRDRILAAGHGVLAPCVRQTACPALAAENQTCHSDFPWTPPRLVRELSARTGLDKDLIKTTGFVFSASPPEAGKREAGETRYRVVSDPMVNKAGRVRFLICGAAGRFPFSAKRGEGFPAEAAFFGLKRSDLIDLSRPAARETGAALGPETAVTRL